MTLLIDENLPPRWCEFLQAEGFTAIHSTSLGRPGDSDELILAHAIEQQAVVVTQDLDFTRMLALWGSRLPSVIQLRVPCPIPELVGRILVMVLRDYEAKLLDGCLVSVEPERNRIRMLPLR